MDHVYQAYVLFIITVSELRRRSVFFYLGQHFRGLGGPYGPCEPTLPATDSHENYWNLTIIDPTASAPQKFAVPPCPGISHSLRR